MKISGRVYMEASGDSAFSMTDAGDCTVYLIDGGTEYALIDCGLGNDVEMILGNIRKDGLDPGKICKIFLTHGHGDHVGGAYELSQICNAAVYALEETAIRVSQGDEEALSIAPARKTGMYAKNFRLQPCEVTALSDGQLVDIGEVQLKVHRTDGHCSGHASYEMQCDGRTVVFSGDSVFYGGKISLQAIWDCDIQEYRKTCRKLMQIKPDMLFPAHGLFSLNRGYLQVQKAMEIMENLGIPQNN